MDKVELIDKAALLEMLPQICDELNACSASYDFDEHCVGCEVYALHKMLTYMPTIDAAQVRRRGEWVFVIESVRPYETEIEERCSLCGRYVRRYGTQPQDNFCPNCGADMRTARDPENGEWEE